MKINSVSAAGLLLLIGTLGGTAAPKTASPVKIKPGQIEDDPYRFNGAVLTSTARGSGFCAWNPHTFFTAAHVVFGDTTWESPPDWYAAVNAATLQPGDGIRTRGYYRWTEYGTLATALVPEESPFSQDVALAFAFRKLIRGTPAKINLEGSKDLKRNIKTLITGYPAENFYTDKNLGGFFLHKTGPTVTPYGPYEGKALTTTLVTTGPGNSGGPIWSKNPKGKWIASGVLVGGLPSESVVYTFSKDINSLFDAVTPVIRPAIQSPEKVKGVSSTSIFFPYYRAEKIPDGQHKWTTFKVKVSHFGELDQVKTVRLSLDIRTKHRGDLQVMLIAPGGYEALVHNEGGAGKDNLNLSDVDFSTSFTGIVANGEWQVRVQDRLRGDIATFKSFVLEIAATGTASTTP